MASLESTHGREHLERHSLGVSDSGVHRLPGVCDCDLLLAFSQKPRPRFGSLGRGAYRHSILVRRARWSICPLVFASHAAFGLSAESQRPPAAGDSSRERLAPAAGTQTPRLVTPAAQPAPAHNTGALSWHFCPRHHRLGILFHVARYPRVKWFANPAH